MWEQNSARLKEKRQNAVGQLLSSVLLGIERPWILGGEGYSNNVSSSAEFYTGSNWVLSENKLHEGKFGACAAKINKDVENYNAKNKDEQAIILIGGKKTYKEVEPFDGLNDFHHRIKIGGIRGEAITVNKHNGARKRNRNVDEDWSWLNHGRYLHTCEIFPTTIVPQEGTPYTREAIIVAG